MRKVCLKVLLLALFVGIGPALFAQSIGPDVTVSTMGGIARNGTVGAITAYSLATTSCNVGNQVAIWIDPTQNPVIGGNMYRIGSDGMLQQLGMSWLKHGFCAVNENSCGVCQDTDCNTLGIGCADTYGTGLNGAQNNLGPKSEVNASTGEFVPLNDFSTGNSIYKRLQVRTNDLTPALNPGASYFATAQYITVDETAWGNMFNNNSWRQFNVGTQAGSGGWNLNYTGGTHEAEDPIMAWQSFDASVQRVEVATPEEGSGLGQVILGTRVEDLGGGQFRYQYALFNNNSHRSVRSFSVPLPSGIVLSNIEFRDVDYHSGEPYSGTDWAVTQNATSITWSTGTGTNDNALRWGTTYSFSFDAPAGPTGVTATLGLFRASATLPSSITVATSGPDGNFINPVSALSCVESANDSVTLGWTNNESYSSIEVARDGLTIATVAGGATSYIDSAVGAGSYVYTVTGFVGGNSAGGVDCGVQVLPPTAPTIASCIYDGSGIALSWSNGESYTNVEVRRNGALLATLPGASNSYVDSAVTPATSYNYSVRGVVNGDLTATDDCVGEVPAGPVLLFGYVVDSGAFTYDQTSGAGSFSVTVHGQEMGSNVPFGNPTYGFSVALAHDANLLSISSVELATPVATLVPEFFGPGILTDGFGAGVIYDFNASVSLMMTSQTALLDVTYATNPAAFAGNGVGANTTLDFDNSLTPAALNVIGLANAAGADAIGVSGVISLAPGVGSDYLRADVNNDGSVSGLTDALALLNWQFNGGVVPPCFAAADINADGNVQGLTDGLYILNWAFSGGSAPSAPFPACGPDAAGVSALGCDTPSCP